MIVFKIMYYFWNYIAINQDMILTEVNRILEGSFRTHYLFQNICSTIAKHLLN